MNNFEKKMPFEKGDMEQLMNRKRRVLPFLVGLNLIMIPVLLFAFVQRAESVWLMLFFVLLMTGISVAIYYFVAAQYKVFETDYKNKVKIVSQTKISDKYTTGYGRYRVHYLVADNRSLKINYSDFQNYEINDEVRLEIAPISNYVIKISKINLENKI